MAETQSNVSVTYPVGGGPVTAGPVGMVPPAPRVPGVALTDLIRDAKTWAMVLGEAAALRERVEAETQQVVVGLQQSGAHVSHGDLTRLVLARMVAVYVNTPETAQEPDGGEEQATVVPVVEASTQREEPKEDDAPAPAPQADPIPADVQLNVQLSVPVPVGKKTPPDAYTMDGRELWPARTIAARLNVTPQTVNGWNRVGKITARANVREKTPVGSQPVTLYDAQEVRDFYHTHVERRKRRSEATPQEDAAPRTPEVKEAAPAPAPEESEAWKPAVVPYDYEREAKLLADPKAVREVVAKAIRDPKIRAEGSMTIHMGEYGALIATPGTDRYDVGMTGVVVRRAGDVWHQVGDDGSLTPIARDQPNIPDHLGLGVSTLHAVATPARPA